MEETIFTLVAIFQFPAEASIYKGRLETEGIEVFMRDDATINANPLYSNAVGGVKLYVLSKDAEKSLKVLSEISKYSFDDNNKLISCPLLC